ncbi:MAG: hypothetical protein JO267_15760 [Alphaproteobacteria bacterium]|nr:hypothetical protein [Alphaproteobacteria bacterium]
MKLAFDGEDLLPVRLQLIDSYIFAPEDAAALMDLAVIEQIFGNLEVGLARQAEALELCRLYRSPASAAAPGLRLLAIAAAGDIGANIPLEFLIEGSGIALHTLYIVPGLPLPEPLPAHDVALVTIGEADANRAALAEIAALIPGWPRPVLNHPGHIARLGREALCALLRPVSGTTIPTSVRLPRERLRRLGQGGLAPGDIIEDAGFPLIVRPVDSHAGRGLARLDDGAAVAPYLALRPEAEFHLSPFVDYRGGDGLYRKYRVAFIDGQPFPVHMAALDDWKIWYVNAGMDRCPAKRAEEAAFLGDFATGFGGRHAAALAGIAERVGLDYFGIDCAETRDGRLLVFEADIAQVVHDMDPPEIFPYKRPAMQRLFAAFRDMLQRKRS